MSTGTDGGLLEAQQAQSFFKHSILDQYISRFIAMPGSTSLGNRVVILDGFAGKGRYPDGTPGSAEQMLQAARKLAEKRAVTSFFTEKDDENYASLRRVVDEYVAAGLDAKALHGHVQVYLDQVIEESKGAPLFLFLDPCGAGLPFEQLVQVLTGPRRAERPQTELLLNFNAGLTRRVAGALARGRTEQRVMDETCGGDWWREVALAARRTSKTNDFRDAVEVIAARYAELLARETGMQPAVVPIKKRFHHAQPVFHMVFFTRSVHGTWVFGDAVGRAKKKWLHHLGRLEDDTAPDDGGLFAVSDTFESVIDGQEKQAEEIVTSNLRALLKEHEAFRLVDHARSVYGSAYGSATETTISRAVKKLKAAGELVELPNTSGPNIKNRAVGRPR